MAPPGDHFVAPLGNHLVAPPGDHFVAPPGDRMAFPNPYAPPSELVPARSGAMVSPLVASHQVGDHRLSVAARYLPKRLFLMGEIAVQVDDGEPFRSAKAALTEDFRWEVPSQGGDSIDAVRTNGSADGSNDSLSIVVR